MTPQIDPVCWRVECIATKGKSSVRLESEKNKIVQKAGANTKSVNVSQRLFDPKSKKVLNLAISRCQKHVTVTGNPNVLGVPKFGWNIVAADYIQEFMNQAEELRQEFLAEKEIYIESYDQILTAAEEFRGELFNEADYPTRQEMYDSLDVQFVYTPVISMTHSLFGTEMQDAEKEQLMKQQESMYNQMGDALVSSILELSKQAESQYEEAEDGSKKRFRKESIERLAERLSACTNYFPKGKVPTWASKLTLLGEDLKKIGSYKKESKKTQAILAQLKKMGLGNAAKGDSLI